MPGQPRTPPRPVGEPAGVPPQPATAPGHHALPVWLLLFAVIMLGASLRAPIVVVGPVVGPIRDSLGLSASLMGFVTALPLMAFAFCSPWASRLAQRFGMERVLIAAHLVLIIGLGVRAGFASTPTLILGTALMSAAIAMSNVLLPALAKRNLPDRIGLVVGCMTTAMLISSGIASAIAVPLADWQGWPLPLAVWVLPAGLAMLGWWRVSRYPHPDAGQPQSGMAAGMNVWRIPAAWTISLFMGIQSLIFYALAAFMPSMLAEKGSSAAGAGSLGALLQIVSLLGVLAVSFVPARGRARQLLALTVALMVLTGVLGIWLGSSGSMWLWISLIGVGTASIFSLCLVLFAARTDHSAEAAAVSGMAQTVGYSVAVLGPLGVGVLYEWVGSWTHTMPLLVILGVVECLIAWSAASPVTLGQTVNARPAAGF